MKYDYLIVGTGLFGSVFAREMANLGAKVVLIDRRDHIGGNCYTRNDSGINVHQYGPHIFNTNNKEIWDYIRKWAEFNHFVYRPRVMYQDKLFSFPINLLTLYQLWGVKTPEEARRKLEEVRVKIEKPANLEQWVLSQVGEEIYRTFIYGYTKKQWGCEPHKLPSFIVRRVPIRLTFDDNYYTSKYQGIPIGGYTAIFEKMLDGLECHLQTDFMDDIGAWEKIADRIVYTGAIDEFWRYCLGTLDWRSLQFVSETHQGDYQGVAAVNYTAEDVIHTRIVEHKHFEFGTQDHTVITKECPVMWGPGRERYYPINNDANDELFRRYDAMIDRDKYIFGGRLARYRYFDMDQVIGMALKAVSAEKTG